MSFHNKIRLETLIKYAFVKFIYIYIHTFNAGDNKKKQTNQIVSVTPHRNVYLCVLHPSTDRGRRSSPSDSLMSLMNELKKKKESHIIGVYTLHFQTTPHCQMSE